MKHWYVVYTKPRQECAAELQLRRQKFEPFLPFLRHSVRRRKGWREVVDPLFPRYLFIRLQLERDNIAPVCSTRGVIDLVRIGNRLHPLPDEFVDNLSEEVQDGAHVHQPLSFAQGDLVRILPGPFAATRARFDLESGEGRISLLLNLLGRSHHIHLDRKQIAPAS